MSVNQRAVLVRLGDVSSKILLKKRRPDLLAKDIELAPADEPVLRIGLDELAPGEGHGAEVCELRRVAHGVGLEKFTMLRARKPVAMLIPFIFDFGQPARGASGGEISDRVIALDRQRDLFRSKSRYRRRKRGGCDQQT